MHRGNPFVSVVQSLSAARLRVAALIHGRTRHPAKPRHYLPELGICVPNEHLHARRQPDHVDLLVCILPYFSMALRRDSRLKEVGRTGLPITKRLVSLWHPSRASCQFDWSQHHKTLIRRQVRKDGMHSFHLAGGSLCRSSCAYLG